MNDSSEEITDPQQYLEAVRANRLERYNKNNLTMRDGKPVPTGQPLIVSRAVKCSNCSATGAIEGIYDLSFMDSHKTERLFFGVPAVLCGGAGGCNNILLERELLDILGGDSLGVCVFAIASDLTLLR